MTLENRFINLTHSDNDDLLLSSRTDLYHYQTETQQLTVSSQASRYSLAGCSDPYSAEHQRLDTS